MDPGTLLSSLAMMKKSWEASKPCYLIQVYGRVVYECMERWGKVQILQNFTIFLQDFDKPGLPNSLGHMEMVPIIKSHVRGNEFWHVCITNMSIKKGNCGSSWTVIFLDFSLVLPSHKMIWFLILEKIVPKHSITQKKPLLPASFFFYCRASNQYLRSNRSEWWSHNAWKGKLWVVV